MKSEIKIDDGLIVRYLAGEATPEEALALDDWLENPANKSYFLELQNTWNASFPGKFPRSISLESAWNSVNEKKGNVRMDSFPARRILAQKTFYKIAAAVLLLVTFAVFFYVRQHEEYSTEITLASGDSLQNITLSDRSSVVLNRSSIIRYPKTFGNPRELTVLEGEAFFRVSPDAANPFFIHTGYATIKVIGTTFNVVVKSTAFEVSVETGKVLVYTPTDSVFLEPDQAATLTAGSPSFMIKDSNQNTWAYATHKYTFNNTPLHEVFGYVESAQHCAIRMVNPDIGNCKLTATFESVSTEYMLTLITEALNLSVTKNDDRTFTVEGEGCR